MSNSIELEPELKIRKVQRQLVDYFAAKGIPAFNFPAETPEAYTRHFTGIYPQRPVLNNVGGGGLVPNYWLFVVTRWLAPDLIVESGVWKGQSSWILRRARPTAVIHAFDISFKNLQYKDDTIRYYECDWMEADIKNNDPGKGLVFFDDHINQAKRVREAYERGYKWLIFDDNVPTGEIYKVGVPALPSIGMLFDPQLKEGAVITWELNGKKHSYTFAEDDTFGARELIDYYLVFPTYTCVTLVKLK